MVSSYFRYQHVLTVYYYSRVLFIVELSLLTFDINMCLQYTIIVGCSFYQSYTDVLLFKRQFVDRRFPFKVII